MNTTNFRIENDFITFQPAIFITDARLVRLGYRIDRCIGSEDTIRIVRRIVRCGMRATPERRLEAIEMLAALLDSPGPIGAAAVAGLVKLRPESVAVAERVERDSLDRDAIAHAKEVLRRIDRILARHAPPPPLKRAA